MFALSHVRKSPVFASLPTTAQDAVTDAWFEGLHFDIEVTLPAGVFIVRSYIEHPTEGFTTIDPDGAIIAEGAYCWGAAVADLVDA